jgi:hypothetical protein
MNAGSKMNGKHSPRTVGPKPGVRKKKPSVAAILRESYRIHLRDRQTQQAVRACLGSVG